MPRAPLVNTSVNLAGQPSKVGGVVARVFGWIVLAGGWVVAMLVAGLIALLGGDWAAFVVGGPIALLSTGVAWALLRGGKELKRAGDDTALAAKTQAIVALANARGGIVKAWDVAQALQLTLKEGDDILTKLTKEHPDFVVVDLDDQGNLLYRFPAIHDLHWGGLRSSGSPQVDAPHVRVPVPNEPRVPSGVDASVRVDAREAGDVRDLLDDELEPRAAERKMR